MPKTAYKFHFNTLKQSVRRGMPTHAPTIPLLPGTLAELYAVYPTLYTAPLSLNNMHTSSSLRSNRLRSAYSMAPKMIADHIKVCRICDGIYPDFEAPRASGKVYPHQLQLGFFIWANLGKA
jgi:hypothetical protein